MACGEIFSGRETMDGRTARYWEMSRLDRVWEAKCFWYTSYTKRRRFDKRGNPNPNQNGAVLANAFSFFSFFFFLFFLLEGYFSNFNLQNNVVSIFFIHFDVNN